VSRLTTAVFILILILAFVFQIYSVHLCYRQKNSVVCILSAICILNKNKCKQHSYIFVQFEKFILLYTVCNSANNCESFCQKYKFYFFHFVSEVMNHTISWPYFLWYLICVIKCCGLTYKNTKQHQKLTKCLDNTNISMLYHGNKECLNTESGDYLT
jgi:hypothetical protein